MENIVKSLMEMGEYVEKKLQKSKPKKAETILFAMLDRNNKRPK